MTVSVAQAQLFFLAVTRILAIIIHVPVLGGRSIPDMVKIGFGFLLAIVIIPWQPLPPSSTSMPALAFAFAMGQEILIGTLAGFAAVLTFSTFQIAGNLMGLSSGFGAGQILNPAMDSSGTAMDQIFIMTALLLFLVLNAHHVFLIGLQRTFEVVPLNSPLPELSSERLLRLTAGLITAGVQMSLPVLGTLLLTDVTLGLLARVAPQVHVFFLGISLKVSAGLVALALAFTILYPMLSELFNAIGTRTLQLLGA
jgi:flagellar biosynthetic protein FliR